MISAFVLGTQALLFHLDEFASHIAAQECRQSLPIFQPSLCFCIESKHTKSISVLDYVLFDIKWTTLNSKISSTRILTAAV